MQKRVLFIDEVHPQMPSDLESLGYTCELGYNWPKDKVLSELENYTGVVIRSKFTFSKAVFSYCNNLKWIARSGSGMENIDVEEAAKRGIICINSPEGNCVAVAEHAIGMLLSLFNHLRRGDLEVRAKQWNREKNRGLELHHRKVGIIGYGHVGSALARRLKAFGCAIYAYDKYKNDFAEEGIIECDLNTIKQECDIISIHLPQTAETLNFINQNFIDSVARPFYFINTSRGKQVVTADLLNGLKSGKIIGACLDVLEYESSSFTQIRANAVFDELLKQQNVIFSPHVAGWTVESYEKLARVLVAKIKARFHA